MGQYHVVVNLDKREYICPHKLGCGLKLWEQLANGHIGGTGGALIVLLACSNGRGGGDFDEGENWHGPERVDFADKGPMPDSYPKIAKRTIGRWAGDRIAVVGDYATDGDLPAEFEAGNIYRACRTPEDIEETIRYCDQEILQEYTRHAYQLEKAKAREAELRQYQDELRTVKLYTDISEDVLAVLVHELHLKIDDDKGWRDIRRED